MALWDDLVNALGSNSQLRVEEAQCNPPAAESVIEEMVRRYPVVLPPVVVDFYRERNGATLRWSATEALASDDGMVGCLNIVTLEEYVTRQHYTRTGWVVEWDVYSAEAQGALVFDGRSEPTVHFYMEEEALIDTGRTLQQYWRAGLEARGFWNWIQALTPATASNPEAVRFREFAPTLFADIDMSLFEVRSR